MCVLKGGEILLCKLVNFWETKSTSWKNTFLPLFFTTRYLKIRIGTAIVSINGIKAGLQDWLNKKQSVFLYVSIRSILSIERLLEDFKTLFSCFFVQIVISIFFEHLCLKILNTAEQILLCCRRFCKKFWDWMSTKYQ